MSEQTGDSAEPTSPETRGAAMEGSASPSEKQPAGCFWPVVLFLATCGSTCFVGAAHWNPTAYLGDLQSAWQVLQTHWPKGMLYMAAVMGVLGMHELGHFLAARRHRIPASYPYFLPLPVAPFGTLGAVIGLADAQANRRQLFDLGAAGPLTGLAAAFGAAWIGLSQLPAPPQHTSPGLVLHPPLALQWLLERRCPEWAGQMGLPLAMMNPWLMAAWVGLWITGLNMLPIGQLDGGHAAYALLGRRAHLLARTLLAASIAYILIAERYEWAPMTVLLCLLGVDHPPTAHDALPLDTKRRLLALAVLAIPFFCFTLQPVSLR